MEEELIIAFLNNDCSPEEKSRVETWINDSPENQKHLDKLKLLGDPCKPRLIMEQHPGGYFEGEIPRR